MRITPQHKEIIIPKTAIHWLDKHNNLNREVRKARIPDYTGRLTRGEWRLNGETISFDNSDVGCACEKPPLGNIIDGQTRLKAIVNSGVAMETFVVVGLDPGVRSTVGCGVLRQFADDLTILGIPDPYHKASIMRAAVLWDRTRGLAQLNRENVTRVGLMEMWPKYAESVEEAAPAKKYVTGVPLTSGAASLFWWILRRHGSDVTTITHFFNVFADGSQEPAEKGIVRLRKFLDHKEYNPDTGRQISHPKQAEIYFLLLAWNDWLAPDKPPRYRKPDKLTDPFPAPVTGYRGKVG